MDSRAREAAESLLTSVSPQYHQPYHYRNFSHSQSLNLVAEDMVAGHRPEGRMSSVRRFFCLFVTFDLLFTSLMWLICVMMRGETLMQIFTREIINYNIKTSLFDIVLVAITRFIVLLLFYALFYINNWSVIALSTAGTCAFLIGKVFLFDWPDAAQPVYQVFLILSSFTLSWGEAWFLDFRVLPQELQAKRILDAIVGTPSERAPLLPGRPAGLASAAGESTVNWFSPVESPESSPRPRQGALILTQDQIDEYKRQAEESMQSAFHVINLPDWRTEKRGAVRGDVVESRSTEKFGKVYRFTGLVDCPAKFLFEEFRDNIARLPDWNPTILKSEVIKEIGPGVDLTYQVTAGGGRGIISPRDFVILRRAAPLSARGEALPGEGGAGGERGERPACYVCSGSSAAAPSHPPVKGLVRGNNKVGCWLLKPVTVKSSSGRLEERTSFQWLMCCDLKGKIPQFVLDTAFATVMLEYIVHVRKFVAEARSKGMF